MFSTATRTLLLCISLSAFVVNEVMAKKKKKIDLAGQYFATYNYYETGLDTPSPGATYQTFSTVDTLKGIYEWRECYCFVNNDGDNVYDVNEGTATLLDDKTGDYRVNIKLSETSSITDGFTYIGRATKSTKKTKGEKNKLQYSLQSFFNTATFTAVTKPNNDRLDDDACPYERFDTNCGLF